MVDKSESGRAERLGGSLVFGFQGCAQTFDFVAQVRAVRAIAYGSDLGLPISLHG